MELRRNNAVIMLEDILLLFLEVLKIPDDEKSIFEKNIALA